MKTIILLCAVTLMLVALVANAAPAVVGMFEGDSCSLFDGDGNLVDADGGQFVIANNARGNGKLTCHAEGVVNNTGKAVHFSGFGCSTPSGFTTRTRAVISNLGDGTGDATLQCRTPD